MSPNVVLAIAAHPDDIEFVMAGTLLRLAEAGWTLHYFNVANGCCGSMEMNRRRTVAVRRREAREAAGILGAHFHPSLANDLEITYSQPLLRRIAAVVREARPRIVLTHSLEDYMEDHMYTARLAVTAAFARGMPNFPSVPSRPVQEGDCTVYHAMPHGLCDGMRRRIIPESFVDVTSVTPRKREALAAHRSQHGWLDSTQGMSSYLDSMETAGREVGRMSKRFVQAEGWRRHSHLGFCSEEADPLREALGKHYRLNPAFVR